LEGKEFVEKDGFLKDMDKEAKSVYSENEVKILVKDL